MMQRLERSTIVSKSVKRVSRRSIAVTFATLGLALTVVIAASESGDGELSGAEAVLLGVVEGLTEYLPVSSTAHLAIVEDLLGLAATSESQQAADSYAIVIQVGAIASVLGLYRRRIMTLLHGVVGSDDEGRRIALAVLVAFLPAAGTGLVAGDIIKDELFSTWPIVVAWFVGGRGATHPRVYRDPTKRSTT